MGHPIDHIREYLSITPEVEVSLRSIMREHKFKRGDTISGIGNIRTYAFFIKKGSARVYFLRDGKEHTYSFAFDDEFVSVARQLLQEPDSITTIEFLEPTEIVFIPLLDTHTIMEDYGREHASDGATFLITALIEHIKYLDERIILFQTASAVERYRWLLQRYPKILERATITQIASFLGVTKETLYRIRAGRYK